VLFTGTKPNYNKEFSLSFGDYVELHNGTDNISKERSVGAIALFPVGNTTGSWQFWCFGSRFYVRRSTWTKMVTTDVVTRTMNNFALQDPLLALPVPALPVPGAEQPNDQVAAADSQPADADDEEMPDLADADNEEMPDLA